MSVSSACVMLCSYSLVQSHWAVHAVTLSAPWGQTHRHSAQKTVHQKSWPQMDPGFLQLLAEMRLSLFILFLLWGNVDVSLSQNACSQLPDVPHAYVSEDTKRTEYPEQHVIHFKCETGYISGLNIRYVCTSAGWKPSQKGSCYLKPCELPSDISNGHYQITRGEDFVFGTQITYFCNEGYYMNKEVNRTCTLNGWTGRAPECESLNCDYPPNDEGVTVKGLPDHEDDPILPDRFLDFSCDGPGKRLNSTSRLICGKDGQWDNPFPSCVDVTCNISAMHPHLHADGLSPANNIAKIGLKLLFYCDYAYTLDGPQKTECLQNGQWSSPFPTCHAKCKVPRVQGGVLFTPRHFPGDLLGKGQKLNFACSNFRHVIHGTATVECLPNGQWSGNFPTCGPPVGCGRPPPLADADIEGSLKSKYSHNERVEYTCQQLYVMEGGPHRTCNNGNWTGDLRCLKVTVS
uniref:sushi, von Willebrand factor type A, EGF and pentraxin domain-containing protein 1-like isoform X2 n=1 Tax=Monopterus albus TaxID=43700 RepID=UPI0009B42E7E|nr:sushi, von Willebrand factor type A, EGF and pentraxin domain-containing protein 1-like isoform X2 [Monopterus albus]